MFYRIKAPRAQDFKAPCVLTLKTDIGDDFTRPMVLFDEVCASIYLQRVDLTGFRSVINSAWLYGLIEYKWFPFKIENGDEHGAVLTEMDSYRVRIARR